MFELTSYLGLFLAAFGAASLLPMQSEAVLVGMLLSGKYAALTLLAIATLGNVLGSVLNWLLGRSVPAAHAVQKKKCVIAWRRSALGSVFSFMAKCSRLACSAGASENSWS